MHMVDYSGTEDTVVTNSGYTLFEKGYFLLMVLVGVAVAGAVGWLAWSLVTAVSHSDAVSVEIEAIRYGDGEDAMRAADNIVSLGSEAHEAVAPLAELARDEDTANREIAIRTLGRLGGKAGDAIPTLTYLFLDNDAAIRLAAVEAIGAIGLEARQAAPELADIVQFDSDPAVARAAVLALGDVVVSDDESIATLVSALDRRNEGIRADAALTLGRIGTLAAGAREPLSQMADIEATAYVRVRAAWAAFRVDPEMLSPDRDIAVALLRDPDARARSLAAGELAALARRDARVVVDLLDALDDEAPAVRRQTVVALARLPNPGPETVDALVETLDDPDASVRGHAAWALGEIGAAAAAPMLIGLLDDEDAEVQEEACTALKSIHIASGKALEDVDKALTDHPLHEGNCGHH